MPRLLQDTNREYKRFRHSVDEKIKLANEGLQHVLSSNVSAVGSDADDLIIRFHNGSLYSYPNRFHQLDDILRAPSKGRWVWTNLRKNNAKFNKIGTLPLKNDLPVSDDRLFEKIDRDGLNIEKLIGNQINRKSKMGLLSSIGIGLSLPTLKDIILPTK